MIRNRFNFVILLVLLVLNAPRVIGESNASNIAGTKHNLSTSGPGPVKAVGETQICIFCHTPHGATATPLWNRAMTAGPYVVASPGVAPWGTLKSRPQNPPDGDSRLCLSCHDGTIAIGSVVNLGGSVSTISMQGAGSLTASGALSPSSPSHMGADLSGHHPVSIEVNSSLMNDKTIQCNNSEVSFGVCMPLPPVVLRPTDNIYGSGPHTNLGVQCSSCHDAHDDPSPGVSMFLRVGTAADTTLLCNKCHLPCGTACK